MYVPPSYTGILGNILQSILSEYNPKTELNLSFGKLKIENTVDNLQSVQKLVSCPIFAFLKGDKI